MEQTEQHVLTVENCKRITATQIESVDSFSPTQLVISYKGQKIVISGSDMKIISFSKQTGAFAATGSIAGVKYSNRGTGFKQKLFR